MRANLPQREPLILAHWRQKDLYRLILDKNKDKQRFILHDGPPYANGNIHIGHALNKILKDIIVKYKSMQGFFAPFVPGWDCHGLPVEHALFKELNRSKHEVNQLDFRRKAYRYALRFVDIQKDEFKRLGVFGDWTGAYLTLERSYEAAIVRSFGKLVKGGYVYRGLKPVNWCYRCETALAEAEVEYEERTSPSIYVKFRLTDNKIFRKDTCLVIWTTTPWTLIANVAVAVHPDLFYSHIETEQGDIVIADVRREVLSQIGIGDYRVVRKFKGEDLQGLIYEHPFGLRKGKVVLAEYVSKEEGTGIVHTAPGHGAEDYLTGLKYNLDTIMPVDERGNFDSTAGEFKGLNVYAANGVILEKLRKLNLLLWSGQIRHSYPHCWRCKEPIIFRATHQWFLKIDHNNLRENSMRAVETQVRWIPRTGKERIAGMLNLRPDWCLSRQRYWGVPIPACVCRECGEEFLFSDVIEAFARIVENEGTDAWFIRPEKDFAIDRYTCTSCNSGRLKKSSDILDVWFDSGVSHQAVLRGRGELGFPADLYLEGSDQHRGWFQSSLIPSMAIEGASPFKIVLTHGFVVDGEGRKMSKSQGNVIAPQDIIKKYGADILRLWVASSDYKEDIRISGEILARLSESYRKIRNTLRFILSNLYDFNPERDKVDYGKLRRIDKWILFGLEHLLLKKVERAYENFEFYKAFQAIYEFCNIELSSLYLDMVKGRLYTCASASTERRAAQSAMYEILNVLVRVMAPILAFTAEEVWQNMPKEKKDISLPSVHLSDWPSKNPLFAQEELIGKKEDISSELKVVIGLIPEVTKTLEEKRARGIIGSSFDAKIKLLTNNEERYKFLTSLKDDLCEIFKVSQVEILFKQDLPHLDRQSKVSASFDIAPPEVVKAEGKKCKRCWNFREIGVDKEYPEICLMCLDVLKGRRK